jgi:hypothetical protein
MVVVSLTALDFCTEIKINELKIKPPRCNAIHTQRSGNVFYLKML